MASIDPRERLVQIGNELLDNIYFLHNRKADAEATTELLEKHPEDLTPEAAGAAFELALAGMRALQAKQTLTEQYVMLRQTIEALDSPRVDVPHID